METAADFALVHSYGGYTTNLPLEDLLDGQAWVAFEYDGEELAAEHGGPARLLVPHLYFWKSAKWVRGLELIARGRAGLLGAARLPRLRRPVARAAVPGGLTARRAWRPAVLAGAPARDRAPRTRSCSTCRDWPGHLAGQHVDVRLTAEDGYQAARSYSLAAPGRTATGSRSPSSGSPTARCRRSWPTSSAVGDAVEVRGPLGGWFVWRPERARTGAAGRRRVRRRPADGDGPGPGGRQPAPFRLLYSVRTPDDRIYADELRRRAAEDGGLDVAWVHTRVAPDGDPRPPGRIRAEDLAAHGWPPDFEPTCYVCGPTGFVEAVARC